MLYIIIPIKFSLGPAVVKGGLYTTGQAVLPKAVNAAIGKAAASSNDSFTGFNINAFSGSTVYSAKPPISNAHRTVISCIW
jgi:hypothetical protein